jgi:hypothetical protein
MRTDWSRLALRDGIKNEKGWIQWPLFSTLRYSSFLFDKSLTYYADGAVDTHYRWITPLFGVIFGVNYRRRECWISLGLFKRIPAVMGTTGFLLQKDWDWAF